MPQGGIDAGEAPLDAAFRELAEETGIRSAELIYELPDWLLYDLPEDLIGKALKDRFRGQKQNGLPCVLPAKKAKLTWLPMRRLNLTIGRGAHWMNVSRQLSLLKNPFIAYWRRASPIYHVNVMSVAIPVIDFSAFGDDSAAGARAGSRC